jgi:hypothetical protein
VYGSPELSRHHRVIEDLGVAGMSSDESGKENGQKVFRVRRKFWRAAALGPFLHTIDRVTNLKNDVVGGNASQKFQRLPGGPDSSYGPVVSKLPVNFYDAAWLANIKANAKPIYDSLGANPEEYALVHDERVQE